MKIFEEYIPKCARCGRPLKHPWHLDGHGCFGKTCLDKYKEEKKEQVRIEFKEKNIYQLRWEEFKKLYGLEEIEEPGEEVLSAKC